MKVFISTGEVSGDMHAAKVALALKAKDPTIEILAMGGDALANAGATIVRRIDDLGVIGITEVIGKLPFFFRLKKELVQRIQKEQPDVVVCVDYPGFHLELAKAVKQLGIPVVYYIAPTIWAWHKSRGKKVAKRTDVVASIFSFEKKAYEDAGANPIFVGHPLLDAIPSHTDTVATVFIGEPSRTM